MQNKQVVQAKDAQHSVTAIWHGPLPHPAALRQYEEILPGTAERIIKLAERGMDLTERQSAEQHEAEMARLRAMDRDLEQLHADTRRGQICGMLAALAAFGSAIAAVALGSPAVALAIVGATIATIVQAFVQERRGKGE